MRKLVSAACMLAGLAATLLPTSTAMAADPIAAFEADRQAAWNAHDAAAYAAAFAADAGIITALGWHWTGQAEAARNLGDGFRFIYAQAQLQISAVQTRLLTPQLTLVTLSWAIAGARQIDTGLPAGVQRGIETQLLERRGESWVILSQQDTTTAMTAASASLPASPAAHQPSPPMPPPAIFPTAAPPARRCIVARANGQCLLSGKAKKPPAN